MPRLKTLTRLFVVVALAAPLLGSCYLPDRFQAEIRISPTGQYVITYRGILTWVPLYADIVQNKLSPAEETEKTQQIKDDLARDSHFNVIESMGEGRFNVRFQREGQMAPTDFVSFVRRNAKIMTIESQDGKITIRGKALNDNEKAQLDRLNLPMRGLLRVVTGGNVTSHNADQVKSFQGYAVYDWHFQGAPKGVPKLVMNRL